MGVYNLFQGVKYRSSKVYLKENYQDTIGYDIMTELLKVLLPNLLHQRASTIPKLHDIFVTTYFLNLRNLSVTKNKCHEHDMNRK